MILIERIGEWYYKTLGASLICSPMSFLPAITIPSAKQGAKIRGNSKNYYMFFQINKSYITANVNLSKYHIK